MQFKSILLFTSALAGFAIANPVPGAEPVAIAEAEPAANPMPNAIAMPVADGTLDLAPRSTACAKAGKTCNPPARKCCGDLHCGGAGLCV